MNLDDIRLNAINQTQKDPYCMTSLLLWSPKESVGLTEAEKWHVVLRDCREEAKGGVMEGWVYKKYKMQIRKCAGSDKYWVFILRFKFSLRSLWSQPLSASVTTFTQQVLTIGYVRHKTEY